MKLFYFINYIYLIDLSRCDQCTDDPLFRHLCKQEYCNNPEAYETCPETCGACTGARSVNLFGDRLYEEGQKCDSNVESILRCEHSCIIRGNKLRFYLKNIYIKIKCKVGCIFPMTI